MTHDDVGCAVTPRRIDESGPAPQAGIGDAAEFLAAVHSVLKPGGVFGIIDHVGNPDGDNNSMHRIDKALAIEMATAAGFTVEGDSDLLANPDDDHTQSVFSEGLRGHTDRFLLKLRKQAE